MFLVLMILAVILPQTGCVDKSPIVPMSEYIAPEGKDPNWRALDCWQCFQAQGRMCHHKNYKSIW